ncbi:MAG: glycosyltransferase family 39 protein [Candidatus Saccharibacteria bacterium]|nr:glycosyltransferase family 39 protein [Candidatus Saccharibacteria bacterium]
MKKRFLSIVLPVIIGIIYIVLCCLNLNSSIWFDEAFSHYLVRGSYGEIVGMTAMDVHPPLFYFALKIWSLIFGTGVPAMRFMSIFFGLIAIIFAFQLLKRHFSLKTSTIATAFMALSPMFVRYGQEMRMYTMVFAIVMVATYILDIAIARVDNKKSAKWLWVVYAILLAAGMYTHYFCALAWIAHVVFILYHFKGVKNIWKNKSLRISLILTYVGAVIMYAPWLPIVLKQSGDVQGGFWIPETTTTVIMDTVTRALVYCLSEDTGPRTTLAIALATAFISYFTVKNWQKFKSHLPALIAMIVAIPPLMLLILSLPPLAPVFIERYIAYSTIFLWLFLGLVVAKAWENKAAKTAKITKKIKAKLPAFIASALLIGIAISGISHVTTRTPDGFVKYTMEPMEQLSAEGEPILVPYDWNFYDTVAYSTDKHPVYFYEGWSDYQWGSLEPIRNIRYNVFDSLDEFLKDHDSFWVFLNVDDKLPETITSLEEFKNFEPAHSVSDQHHVAYEFKRKV